MQIELENTEDPLQAEPEANENGQPVTVEIKKEWKKLLHQQWLVRNMSYISFPGIPGGDLYIQWSLRGNYHQRHQ